MKINKFLITSALVTIFTVSTLPLTPNAEPTLKTSNLDGIEYISLAELTKSNNGKITNPKPNFVEYKFKDTTISLNLDSPFLTIGDTIIPIETKEIDGVKLPNFDAKFKKTDTGSVLVPYALIKDVLKLEIKTSKEEVPDDKDKDTKKTNTNLDKTKPNKNTNNTTTKPNYTRPSYNRPNNNSNNPNNNTNNNTNNNNNNNADSENNNNNNDENNNNNNNSNNNNTDQTDNEPKPDTTNPQPKPSGNTP